MDFQLLCEFTVSCGALLSAIVNTIVAARINLHFWNRKIERLFDVHHFTVTLGSILMDQHHEIRDLIQCDHWVMPASLPIVHTLSTMGQEALQGVEIRSICCRIVQCHNDNVANGEAIGNGLKDLITERVSLQDAHPEHG